MSERSANVTYGFRRTGARGRTGTELVRLGDDEQAVASLSPPSIPVGKVPRVTRLLALAHKFERMLARGEVASMADLARAGRVTRARLSQIMDLVLLAPDIQDEIMSFERVISGRDPVTMKEVQVVLRSAFWPHQRTAWRQAIEARRTRPSPSTASL